MPPLVDVLVFGVALLAFFAVPIALERFVVRVYRTRAERSAAARGRIVANLAALGPVIVEPTDADVETQPVESSFVPTRTRALPTSPVEPGPPLDEQRPPIESRPEPVEPVEALEPEEPVETVESPEPLQPVASAAPPATDLALVEIDSFAQALVQEMVIDARQRAAIPGTPRHARNLEPVDAVPTEGAHVRQPADRIDDPGGSMAAVIDLDVAARRR